MGISNLKAGIVSNLAATISSVCCLLPLLVVVLGLGTGAFMVTTMQYSPILIPIGIAGVALGYALYFRERRRCERLACRMAAGRLNLALLITSTVVLVAATALTAFPGYTASLIARYGGADVMPGMAPQETAAPPQRQHASTEATAWLRIEGMT
ncbi:MAG: hypothetical protein L0214_07710 [candidate division NC10 bacterium]|nr:hypothetical protein [candidate division NC10 bacterium]